ncbi:class I SAM-dependent methyltransferase [Patescibacteria group bacterium]|nr:class I SAM-dependent methyltransferase [Patescibacteria group bacterium]
MKFYDKDNKRLIVIEEKATNKFWDRHWEAKNFKKEIEKGKNSWFVKKNTNKFLKHGARVLEGGCGRGQIVYGLKHWGYDAYGVDFAEETVKKINENLPDLKVSFQDVRSLDFPDNFFDGYWSLGVIEHFTGGYEKIIEEAKRVIKTNGYLFLTFPHMFFLRRLKAKLGIYKKLDNDINNNFYCFILNEKEVAKNVEKHGFKLIFKKPFDATKGLKDEIFLLKPILQKVYDSHNLLAKGIKFLNSFFLSKIAGHSILLVLKKRT